MRSTDINLYIKKHVFYISIEEATCLIGSRLGCGTVVEDASATAPPFLPEHTILGTMHRTLSHTGYEERSVLFELFNPNNIVNGEMYVVACFKILKLHVSYGE